MDGGANRKCANNVNPVVLILLLTWNGLKYASFSSEALSGNVPLHESMVSSSEGNEDEDSINTFLGWDCDVPFGMIVQLVN